MKRLMVLIVAMLLCGPSFASKSRTESLGESRTYGSYFIDDARNIFYNPALINDYKDMLAFEFGADYSNTQDTNTTPQAEGGYLAQTQSLVYGLWFGRENNTGNLLRQVADASMPGEDNKFEFFIGGDAGTKWGARLGYSTTENSAASSESTAADASLGVTMGNTEIFGTISLTNDAEFSTAEYDGKLGIAVGAKHKLKNYTVYGEIQHIDFEYNTTAAPAVTPEFSSNELRVGFARQHNLNEKANIFTDFRVEYGKAEVEALGTTAAEYDFMRIPVTIGLEYEAKKWLTFRASVRQSIYSKNDARAFTINGAATTSDFTDQNTTTVGTGAGFNWDNFVIDLFAGRSTTDSFNTRGSLSYNF